MKRSSLALLLLVVSLAAMALLVVYPAAVSDAGEPEAGDKRETKTVKIVSQAEWGGKKPGDGFVGHKIDKITIHHTATIHREKDDAKVQLRSIQAFHTGKELGWPDIAYHYIIDARGSVYKGRPDRYRGDTMTSYDTTGHVLVCLLGNFEKQEPNGEQLGALADIVALLMQKHDVPLKEVYIHKDLAETKCPGKNLVAHWKTGELRDMIAERSAKLVYVEE